MVAPALLCRHARRARVMDVHVGVHGCARRCMAGMSYCRIRRGSGRVEGSIYRTFCGASGLRGALDCSAGRCLTAGRCIRRCGACTAPCCATRLGASGGTNRLTGSTVCGRFGFLGGAMRRAPGMCRGAYRRVRTK